MEKKSNLNYTSKYSIAANSDQTSKIEDGQNKKSLWVQRGAMKISTEDIFKAKAESPEKTSRGIKLSEGIYYIYNK